MLVLHRISVPNLMSSVQSVSSPSSILQSSSFGPEPPKGPYLEIEQVLVESVEVLPLARGLHTLTGVLIKGESGHRGHPRRGRGQADLCCHKPGISRDLGEAGTDTPAPEGSGLPTPLP